MNESKQSEALVTLNVPPELEEPIVDWLLAREDSTGFTSVPVYGHSTRHDDLSPVEQVSGRQRRQQFQIQIRADGVEAFIDSIRESFGVAGIHFWVLPLIHGGHLGPIR
ncbi:MAG: DUF3240 domain-containing protein [Gammaproteobacteria bacterium]|nr:DUF3240 domain-containing protein [Gammaproteobacteria bacterium]